MLITSGFNFEGYRITHYLGFFSGETALGTGVFSEFFASWADFFGTESNSFADKLEEAKHYAMDSLISKVRAAGGNAIIGLDVDYNMFMSNMIGVIANGTAVCVESIGVEKEEAVTAHLPAMPLDIDAPLRATGLRIAGDSVALEMVLYKGVAPRAVSAEVTLRTAFGEDACMGDIAFLDVAPIPGKDGHWLQSGYARLAKPLPTAAISATVRILAQMDTDGVDTLRELRRRYGEDAICTFEEDENGWRCVCGMHNPAQSTRCALCSRQKDGKATALTVEMLAEAEKTAERRGDLAVSRPAGAWAGGEYRAADGAAATACPGGTAGGQPARAGIAHPAGAAHGGGTPQQGHLPLVRLHLHARLCQGAQEVPRLRRTAAALSAPGKIVPPAAKMSSTVMLIFYN